MQDQLSWRTFAWLEKEKVIAVLSAFAALAAGITTLGFSWLDRGSDPLAELRTTIAEQGRLVAEVRQDMDETKRLLSSLQASPGPDVKLVTARLEGNVADVTGRLSKLEEAILSTPERALAVPLLRQDLDRFKEQYQRDIDAVALDVGRAYDINKWVIGLIATAILGLAISNLFAKKPKNKPLEGE